MDGSIVFTRWRQCALPCGHTGATWRMRLNLCFLQPTRVHNPNGKSIGSALPFCTAHGRVSSGTLATPGEYDWTHAFFAPPKSIMQMANRSVQPFLHSSRQILYNRCPFPQNCPFLWGIWTPSNTIPRAHPSPQSKRHLDWFSRFCTDDHRVFLYFTMGRSFPPSKLPLPMGI